MVTLRKSKTDQEGKGRQVPLHYHDEQVCPVRALRAWLNAAGIESGPVFRRLDRWGNVKDSGLHPSAVATIVRDAASAIGLDPAEHTAHSLRAGFVSECDRRGIVSSAVRLVTGHQSAIYTRPQSLFDSSAGAYFTEDE